MNPFKILNIDKNSDQHEIIKAAAIAMQKKEYSGREIAQAQKELMNPTTKAAHNFLHFIDCKKFIKDQEVSTLQPPDIKELKRISIFEEVT